MAVGNYETVSPFGTGAQRRNERVGLALGLAAMAVLAVACVAVISRASASNKPEVASMYHMWLGANGLPVSPRKQRQLLFQFCTTNFVTEEEMRYCYARLLSNGDPSGPVKFAGQPNYDSEQVVSPLFSFAMPASATGGEAEGGADAGGDAAGGEAPAAAAAAQAKGTSKLQAGKKTKLALLPPSLPTAQGAAGEWGAFSRLEAKKTGTNM